VTGVSLNVTSANLDDGSTLTLKATVAPATATNKAVTWSSSSTAASVTSAGLVTALTPGVATITATVDGKTATCVVTTSFAGVVTTLAGQLTAGFANGTGTGAQFDGPCSVATDGVNLFVSDANNNQIRKIVIATGAVSTLAGATTSGTADGFGINASFDSPFGLTTDGTNVYVVDEGSSLIRKIVIATGEVSTVSTPATFSGLHCITTDGTSLYVTDGSDNSVRRVVIATGVVSTLPLTGATVSSFGELIGIITDGSNLYVTDPSKNQIDKIVIATGAVTLFAGSSARGSTDGTGTQALFDYPLGVTTDGTNLYVTETGLNHSANRIREIVIATGEVTTLAGSTTPGSVDGTGTNAQFRNPNALAYYSGRLFVPDTGNNLIRVVR